MCDHLGMPPDVELAPNLISVNYKIQFPWLDQEIRNGVVDVDVDCICTNREFNGVHILEMWAVSQANLKLRLFS
jgi:hypothetical protein